MKKVKSLKDLQQLMEALGTEKEAPSAKLQAPRPDNLRLKKRKKT